MVHPHRQCGEEGATAPLLQMHILSGCITAWYGKCTALNRNALHRDQKDHQDQQPPAPLPVHSATIQKAMSVQVHQSCDRETEKQLLSQGHHTVKQVSLTQRGCCLHTDLKSLATLIMDH